MSTPRDHTSTPRETTEYLARVAEEKRAQNEKKVAAAEALANLNRDTNLPRKLVDAITERHDGTTIGKGK